MYQKIIFITAAALIFTLPQLAMADGDGATTGMVGGAVAGAVVGGPPGAVIGGVAGAIVGNQATDPHADTPCNSQTTRTSDNNGNSTTTRTTNCPN